jgi:D-alanyl-D-alanine carboxypeptidase
VVVVSRPVTAQVGSDRYSSIVIDAASGAVLSSVSADEVRYPASLTKMMTLYMVFEALRDRRIALNTPVPVSAHAAAMAPSKLGLRPGSRLTVEEAILGLVTKSANDAAAALGELLGGEEAQFAQMMTLRARGLGLTHSVFRNASGLPDPDQVSTAHDLAQLGRRLVQDFPTQYRYFSVPSFRFRGRTILNHDHMLTSYPGADGIKTGYTELAGHNLVTSAVRGDVRLIGVVLGAANNIERDSHMRALLDAGFTRLDVPLTAAREMPAGFRMPSLVSTAQAAPLPLAPSGQLPPTQVGATRGRIAPHDTRWGVQVGSFASQAKARAAATSAVRGSDSAEARAIATSVRGKPVWRAVVAGLSQGEAQSACAAISRKRGNCVLLRPESRELASR